MESLKSFMLWVVGPIGTINLMDTTAIPVEAIGEGGKLLVQIALALVGLFKLIKENKAKK
tara:strand:+ start:809 stop:988 length:180 start_codon:yes stop_codon:yes gene_type:complete